MKRLLIILAVSGFIFSCNNNVKEKTVEISASVQMMNSPALDSCAEPYLFTDKNGTVYLSWVEKKGKKATLKFSSLSNDAWSAPVSIASGKNWFVNWADYPVIATNAVGNFIAHYLEKTDTAKFTYDIKTISSADSGKLWGKSKLLNEDSVKAEHGFVSILAYNDGFFACWLDGRKTASEANADGHDGHHGEMTLRAAIIDTNGNKVNEWELDGKVCDCCQTTAAITANGPVVIYRDRSDDEIRDMSIVRFINGQWTEPKTIHADNWQIKACPVNGPRAEAFNNHLAIAWFSMKEKEGEVKIVFSKDGGETFDKPIRINEGLTTGRVDILMLDSTTAVISWMEGATIMAAKVYEDGKNESPVIIASSSDKRSSGFPQMTKAGNKIIFAWTDDKAKTIRTASVSL